MSRKLGRSGSVERGCNVEQKKLAQSLKIRSSSLSKGVNSTIRIRKIRHRPCQSQDMKIVEISQAAKRLENLEKKELTHENMSVYSDLFEQIIKKDQTYGFLMQKLKTSYENYYNRENQDIVNEILKIKEEILLQKWRIKYLRCRQKESKYLEVLAQAKKKGVPVQELYQRYVKRPRSPSTTQSERDP